MWKTRRPTSTILLINNSRSLQVVTSYRTNSLSNKIIRRQISRVKNPLRSVRKRTCSASVSNKGCFGPIMGILITKAYYNQANKQIRHSFLGSLVNLRAHLSNKPFMSSRPKHCRIIMDPPGRRPNKNITLKKERRRTYNLKKRRIRTCLEKERM